MFFGEVTQKENEGLKDLTPREIAVFAPLILMVFLMGVYSKPFISKMEPSVNQFIERVNFHRETALRPQYTTPEGVDVSLPAPPTDEFPPAEDVVADGPDAANNKDNEEAGAVGGTQ